MGQMAGGEADISTGGLSVNTERMRYVDYTDSVSQDFHGIVVGLSNRGQAINIMAYVSIFETASWAVGFLVVLLLATGFAVLSWTKVEAFHRQDDSEAFGFIHGVAVSLITLLQRDYDLILTRNSSRLLFNVTCIYAFLISAYYNAVLTSLMTSRPAVTNIRSFKDINDQNLRVFSWASSSAEIVLKNAPAGSPMHQAYVRVQNDPDVFSAETPEEITDRLLTDFGSVYYGSTIAFVSDPRLRVLTIAEGRISHIAFVLQNQSEFRQLFNFQLQEIRDSGIMPTLLMRWTTEGVEAFDASLSAETASALGYDNLLFPFAVTAVGVVVAYGIAFVELIHSLMARAVIRPSNLGRHRS